MTTSTSPLPFADSTYVQDLEGLYVPWAADAVPSPQVLVLNEDLARELGADPGVLATPSGVGLLVGNPLPEGVQSVAQGYAGHQFGGWSPRLGDGRAVLVGEVVDDLGRRRDIHLKGSGRTPFARGGDGKAAVGPMLREHVISEAMHALGVPTTRALAVVATGEQVRRETMLPGAVLARVGASHLRVGTFQYVTSSLGDPDLLRRLADHAIARHHPHAAEADTPALALFEAVLDVQAALLAQWMHVGFVHGVMNTDNMTISGETIDYGPCAFMDAFDPATVFSSIDHGGRYAYGRQPQAAQWNLARLAEALLPLVDPDDLKAGAEEASAILATYPERFGRYWTAGMHAKLGLADGAQHDDALVDDLLDLLHGSAADWTSSFRALARAARGDREALRPLAADPARLDAWLTRWLALGPDPDAMDRVNPVYIPRNHLVEDALIRATAGDMQAYDELVEVVTRPFDERPGLERYARPAPADAGEYVTYCGT